MDEIISALSEMTLSNIVPTALMLIVGTLAVKVILKLAKKSLAKTRLERAAILILPCGCRNSTTVFVDYRDVVITNLLKNPIPCPLITLRVCNIIQNDIAQIVSGPVVVLIVCKYSPARVISMVLHQHIQIFHQSRLEFMDRLYALSISKDFSV